MRAPWEPVLTPPNVRAFGHSVERAWDEAFDAIRAAGVRIDHSRKTEKATGIKGLDAKTDALMDALRDALDEMESAGRRPDRLTMEDAE